MSQINNYNTKRPKPKENQLGILGISSREVTHYVGNGELYLPIFENFSLIYRCV